MKQTLYEKAEIVRRAAEPPPELVQPKASPPPVFKCDQCDCNIRGEAVKFQSQGKEFFFDSKACLTVWKCARGL
jgi:hypothetical protein